MKRNKIKCSVQNVFEIAKVKEEYLAFEGVEVDDDEEECLWEIEEKIAIAKLQAHLKVIEKLRQHECQKLGDNIVPMPVSKSRR